MIKEWLDVFPYVALLPQIRYPTSTPARKPPISMVVPTTYFIQGPPKSRASSHDENRTRSNRKGIMYRGLNSVIGVHHHEKGTGTAYLRVMYPKFREGVNHPYSTASETT